MLTTTRILIALAAVLCFVTTGCQNVAEPEAGVAAAQASPAAAADDGAALGGLEELGIDLSDAAGVFGIGWREHKRWGEEEAELVGHAHAIAFGKSTEDSRRLRRWTRLARVSTT